RVHATPPLPGRHPLPVEKVLFSLHRGWIDVERMPIMLNLWASAGRSGKLDRRELLRIGALSLPGLSLPLLLEQTAQAAPKAGRSFGKAKNCILLYLSGGPAQLDTFDPKPDAPEDIR